MAVDRGGVEQGQGKDGGEDGGGDEEKMEKKNCRILKHDLTARNTKAFARATL